MDKERKKIARSKESEEPRTLWLLRQNEREAARIFKIIDKHDFLQEQNQTLTEYKMELDKCDFSNGMYVKICIYHQ